MIQVPLTCVHLWKNVKVSDTLGSDLYPVGVGRIGLVPCNVLKFIWWRVLYGGFGGECISRFQLLRINVNVYRFGGHWISKSRMVVVNMLGGMVVRVRW